MRSSNKKLAQSIIAAAVMSASSLVAAEDFAKRFQVMGSTNLSAASSTIFSGDNQVKSRGYEGKFSGKYFLTDIIGIGGGVQFSDTRVKSTVGSHITKTKIQSVMAGPELSAELPITDAVSIEGVVGIYKLWAWGSSTHLHNMSSSYNSTFNKGWAKGAGVNLKLAVNESVSLVLGTSYTKAKSDIKGAERSNELATSLGVAFNF